MVTPENIKQVHKTVLANRKVKVVQQIADILTISKELEEIFGRPQQFPIL